MFSGVKAQIHRRDNERTGRWSPYFISSDATETRHTVGRGICDHVLEHRSTRNRPVSVRYRDANLSKLSLHDMRYTMYEGEARIHVPDMAHIYLCEFNLQGHSLVGQKAPENLFKAGQIYMINANRPHIKRWENDGHQVMIKIPQADMEAAVERVAGLPIRELLVFSHTPQDRVGKLSILSQLVDLLSNDNALDQPFFSQKLNSRPNLAIEETLIDLILEAIPNNYTQRIEKPEPLIRPRHIRHAAEYIHSYFANPISLNDPVLASGVSSRSLHAGFRNYYGVSPLIYLRNVRLDAARDTLKQPRDEAVSVTTVALDCGFLHLSRFAQAYRARFGERPSETLRNY